MTTLWQSHDGGGALGWSSMLLRPYTLATYAKDDWRNDWGELQQLAPIDPTAVPAKAAITTETRSGRWTPGPINVTGWR